jgi:hypothetical protein
MDIYFFMALLSTLLLGQAGSFMVGPGITVHLHDAVVVLWLLASLPKFRTLKFGTLGIPLLLFTGAALLSLVTALWQFPLPSVAAGSLYLWRWLSYVGIGLVVARSTLKPATVARGLYIVALGLGILGLAQYVWYPDLRNLIYLGWDPHYQRLFSTLLDPNFTGVMLVVGILLGAAFLDTEKRLLGWVIAGELLLLGALVLTFSRSSYLALAAGGIMWGIQKKKTALVLTIGALALSVVLFLPKSGEGQNLLRTVSSEARVGNAINALSLWQQRPITGYGFDLLRMVQCRDLCIGEAGSVSRAAAGVDASLLFVLVTTGVVGLIAFGYFLVRLWQYVGASTSPYAGSVITMLGALLVHSLFVNSLFYPWVVLWMACLLGILGKSVRAGR